MRLKGLINTNEKERKYRRNNNPDKNKISSSWLTR